MSAYGTKRTVAEDDFGCFDRPLCPRKQTFKGVLGELPEPKLTFVLKSRMDSGIV